METIVKAGGEVKPFGLNRLEILDIFQGKKCVCGSDKNRRQPHCSFCYHQLPPEQRNALYKRFGSGYEAAFSDSLRTLVELERTTPEKIKAAVPEPADKN